MRVLDPDDGALTPATGQPASEPGQGPGPAQSHDDGQPSPVSLEPAAAPASTPNPAVERAHRHAPGPAPEMLPTPHPHPLVVVHWLDAWYDADEQTSEDWRNDYPVQTVGYLVRHELKVISIAQEVLPDGEGFRAVTHIPRAMVQQIDRLVVQNPTGGGNGPFPQGT